MYDQVGTYVKSATHNWFGRVAVKFRSTRSGARGSRVGNSGAALLASAHVLDAQVTHEASHLAASDGVVLAPELFPELVNAIDAAVGRPGVEDLGLHLGVTHRPGRGRPALRRVVGLRGDLQLPADRLDPELGALVVE
jgi:hypothetical protein